jgi:TolB-like protein
VIKLTSLTDRETVSTDTVYLEGEVVGERAITVFAINGESLWRRPTRQLFFGRKFPLQEGENPFHLEVVDDMGHRGRRDMVVIRAIPRARQLGLRLRISNVPFEKKGRASVLSEAVYDNLLAAFVAHQRFDFVERQQLESILQELKLSQTELIDPTTAARIGKLAAAEGVLVGTVMETPHALDVYARLVDVETSVILAAEDVYGEDLSLPTVKTLMEGLSWKLRRHFPLVEGAIIEKTGKNLVVDLAKGHGIQRYMKLIVFREGEERQHPLTGTMLQKPHAVLGEARITAVADDLSEAVLLRTEQTGDVRELDRVITK